MWNSLFITLFISSPTGRFVTQIDGFLEPTAAFWQADGNIAVFDRMADECVVVNLEGERLHVVSTDDQEDMTAAFGNQFDEEYLKAQQPHWPTPEIRKAGVAAKTDDGWIVPDELSHAICHYDHDGNWIGKWGVHALLPHAGEGKLHYPNAVGVSQDGSNIVVCEGFEGRIQIFELTEGEPESPPLISNIAHFGKHIDSFGDLILIAEPEIGDVYLLRTGLDVPIEMTRFGGDGNAPHQFKWIHGVWIDDGVIKIVGDGNIKTFSYEHDPTSTLKMIPGLVKFTSSQSHETFKGPIESDIVLQSVEDLAITPSGDAMWIVQADEERVRKVTLPDFKVLHTIEGFVEPSGIEIEADGRILVSDIGASNIKRFSPDGELLATFGEKGFEPHQMYKPAGITTLDDGTIVVVDWGNHRAQLYDNRGKWQATFGRGRSWTREKHPPTKTVKSNTGNWSVRFSPLPEDMPLNELFELTSWVSGDKLVKTLRVDAAMPAHGHGMITDPVTELQSDGSFKTTGMLLSMPGKWELYFDIDDGHTIERAQDDITLEP